MEGFDSYDIGVMKKMYCNRLKVLHDQKIVHRDLKSANVFLTLDGVFKLGDLNVSKVAK